MCQALAHKAHKLAGFADLMIILRSGLAFAYAFADWESLSWVLHERHSLRRRALRVPQAEQRMYIVRVNQLVMNALTSSIPIRTAAFSRKSLNL